MATLHLVSRDPLVYSGVEHECALLGDWVGRPVDVVFDFGERDEDVARFNGPVLWQLHPDKQRRVILTPVYTDAFVEMLQAGVELQRVFRKNPPRPLLTPQRSPLPGFHEHLKRMNRRRRRL